MQQYPSRSYGFTLVEAVVVVGITALLMVSITTLFKDIFVNARQENAALGAVDQARLMSANFVNEVRNATYSANGSWPLAEAGDNEIIFYTNYHTGGTINRIRYYISGTNLNKGVVTPSGTPATYNLANEKVTSILYNVTNGTGTASPCLTTSAPAFYYYDGNYNGVSGSPLAQTVNVNSVKFVKLNLSILKQEVTGSTCTFMVNDGVAIRNLKTNLGN